MNVQTLKQIQVHTYVISNFFSSSMHNWIIAPNTNSNNVLGVSTYK